MTIAKLATEVERLLNAITVCLETKVATMDKVNALLEALLVEYAQEARMIRREEYERLYEIIPQSEEFEALQGIRFTPAQNVRAPTTSNARTNQPIPDQVPRRIRYSTAASTANIALKVCQYHKHATNHSTEECFTHAPMKRCHLIAVAVNPVKLKIFIFTPYLF